MWNSRYSADLILKVGVLLNVDARLAAVFGTEGGSLEGVASLLLMMAAWVQELGQGILLLFYGRPAVANGQGDKVV